MYETYNGGILVNEWKLCLVRFSKIVHKALNTVGHVNSSINTVLHTNGTTYIMNKIRPRSLR